MDVSQPGMPTTPLGAVLASHLCRENFANIVKHTLMQNYLMDTMYYMALQRLVFLHLRKHGSGSYCLPNPGAGLRILLNPPPW